MRRRTAHPRDATTGYGRHRAVLVRRWSVAACAMGVAVAVVAALGVAATDTQPATADAVTPVAQPYFVDCHAKTNGTGTSTSPWNSVGAVNSHGAFVPGDEILFKRGTTCNGRVQPLGSGTPGKPIIMSVYGTGAKPIIAGGGTPNDTATVEFVNSHDWTVQYLHITNKGSTKQTRVYRSGLLLLNTGVGRLANMTAQRLTIDSVWSNPGNGNTRAYGGISVLTFGSAATKSGYDHLQILHNTVSNVSRTGIAESNSEYPTGYDANSRIAYNTVRSARGDSIIMIGVKGGRIDHNVSADGGNLGSCSWCGRYGGPSTASAGIWPASSSSIRIDHNEVYGEHAKAGDGEAFDIDRSAKNVVIEQNYAHDNAGGGVLICGATSPTIRFNIFQNNYRAITFVCAPHSTNTRIYNNTIYARAGMSAGSVVYLRPGYRATGVQFVNNLVYTYGSSWYRFPAKTWTADNTFIGRHGAPEPTGHGNSRSDPGLRNAGSGKHGMGTLGGYRLTSTRYAQPGVSIPSSATRDFFGKKVNPKKPFRGASASS